MATIDPSRQGTTWGATSVRQVNLASRLASVGFVGVLFLLTATPLQGASMAGPAVSVIVREQPGTSGRAELSLVALGGTVSRQLPIVGGFSAVIPSGRLSQLSHSPGVASVTPNGPVELAGRVDGYDPKQPSATGSWTRVLEAIKAKDAWKAGFLGQGVDVALIDSGVAPVAGISGQVIYGPDLSFESQADNLRNNDTYGHGTHLAGLIAGRDADIEAGKEDEEVDDSFVGVAPRARVVSIKVATASGATDVSQILAAIDWVVQHRSSDGLNIRVLNLSFGTDGTQSYLLDPLAYAAEVAWRSGIVVVVAAGNSSFGSAGLNNPAFDPYVIAVGAVDTMGTNDLKDDAIPAWSARGTTARGPDLVAPGQSVVSLRTPGSNLDLAHPAARVGNSRFFRGSGTSQSAAVVSGAAAVLLSQRPGLSPDQVKYLLKASSAPLPNVDRQAMGAGLINLKAAKDRATPLPAVAAQLFPMATGAGSLELARGSVHVVADGIELRGEQDIFGSPFVSASWAAYATLGTAWVGGNWNGNTWSGNTWSGNTWSGNTWSGNTWSGNTWSGNTWSGNTWSGNTWSGNTWSGNAWTSTVWQGATWD